jgi:hypothetical protein
VTVEGLSSIDLINENTPAFVTWRRPGDKNFSTTLDIFYRTSVPEDENGLPIEGDGIAKEKTFTIQISSDCKKITVTSP